MKVIREGRLYKVFEGDIISARMNETGNAVITVLTYAKNTPYQIEMTPHDIDSMKILFHAMGDM